MKAIRVVMEFVEKLRKDHVSAFAAQTSYFIIMSAIPLMMLLLSLLQYIPATRDMMESFVTDSLPVSVQTFVLGIVQEVYSKSITAMSITAVVMLWVSAKGMQALAQGLNAVYGIEETRPWIVLRFHAILHTLLMLASIIFLMLTIVFGNTLQQLLAIHFPFLGRVMDSFLSWRLLLSFALLVIIFDIFYVAIPNRKATVLGQMPGALFCAVSWLVFSYFVSVYIDDFNGFSMYGSLTALVIIMFWMYFCMYFLLIGGAINFHFNAVFRRFRIRLRERRRKKKREALAQKANRHGNTEKGHDSEKQENEWI